MTRFARSKGSKASNERICEQATSWQEMKGQLLQKQIEIRDEGKRKEAEEKRNSNYQNFLKEREESMTSQTEWAEFPTDDEGKKKKPFKSSIKKDDKVKKKQKVDKSKDNADSGVDIKFNSIEDMDSSKINKKKSKLSKKRNFDAGSSQTIESDTDAPLEVSSKLEIIEPEVKKPKLKQKKLKIILDKENNNVSAEVNDTNQNKELYGKNQSKKKNINNKKSKVEDLDSLSEADKKKILKKQERRKRQVEKKKLKKQQKLEELAKNPELDSQEPMREINKPKFENGNKVNLKEYENQKPTREMNKTKFQNGNKVYQKKFTNDKLENSSDNSSKITKNLGMKFSGGNKNNQPNPIKKQKVKDGDFKRRKDFQPNKVMINGKEVDLEYFEGFPIKKEDAQNLKKLKKEMISKGLPRSEINRALKLERRKAEKALAREKKKVCFNCRKFGHNLSECQELSNNDNKELIESTGTGICFKCGSTEHTSFVCRVVQGQNFKFATCFICKEQGHISRQCPDNARGLYPKGGACKVCGDVTHLKKDCPQFQVQQEKEHAKFQVETLSAGNLEDLDGYSEEKKPVSNVKPNKIIKF